MNKISQIIICVALLLACLFIGHRYFGWFASRSSVVKSSAEKENVSIPPVETTKAAFPLINNSASKNIEQNRPTTAPLPAVVPSPMPVQEKLPSSNNASAVHAMTTAVVNQGALKCASRVNQVSNFLTSGTQNGGLIFLPKTHFLDEGLMSISYEMNRADGTTAYASAGFGSDSPGCPAVYETIEYGKATCQDIYTQLFSQFPVLGNLKGNITVLNAGELKIFLMPAGESGCVVIKKEMVQ